MSNVQNFSSGGAPGTPNIEFVRGNDGTPVGPNPATHTIDIIGDTTKGVSVTNTAPFTEKVSVAFATYSTPGVSSYNVTNFTVAAGVVSSNNIDIIAGTGLTGGGLVTLGGSVTLNATATVPDLHAARYIVSAGGSTDGANYTTIGAAITAAETAGAPQTIVIQPGTYIEDPIVPPGICLTAFDCDALSPNVNISGKVTFSGTGTYTISGINLQTNSDFAIDNTGSTIQIINLINCYLTGLNNTIINNASTGSGEINLYNCNGDLATTGIAYFTMSGNSTLRFFGGQFQNEGGSLTASTNSCLTGIDVSFSNVEFFSSNITTSNMGILFCENSSMEQTITIGGTSLLDVIYNSQLTGGSFSALSIGAGALCKVADVIISSNATDAITGSGTLEYGLITFTGTSSTVNTTTQTPLVTLPIIGDVIGPASAVSGNFASFNGTSGKIIQDSGVSSASFLQVSNNLSDVGNQATALNNIMPPTPAKGTIAVFNGTDWANLPAGTDTYVLTANSGATDGVDWEAPGGGGGVSPNPFFAYLSTSQVNVTGDGTAFRVNFDTVPYGTFTTGASAGFVAPATGTYFLSAAGIVQLGVNSTAQVIAQIVTPNRTAIYQLYQNAALTGAENTYTVNGVFDMTIGDIAYFTLAANIGAANTCNVLGSGGPYFTYFSGYRVS